MIEISFLLALVFVTAVFTLRSMQLRYLIRDLERNVKCNTDFLETLYNYDILNICENYGKEEETK